MIYDMIQINNEITHNVMDLLKQNSLPTDEYTVQNIIYKTKMDLGNTHPLYEKLPYYWYYNGPFSETIRNSYNDIKNQKSKINTNILKKYPETTENITKIISKGDYVKSALCEDIYMENAPLDIMHTFKYKIFNPTQNEVFIGNSDEYINYFNKCRSKFYRIEYFNDFALLFSEFSSQIDFLNDENLISEKWNLIRKPIQSIWFTFAEGIRCHAHDNYYNNCFSNWNLIFNQSLTKLNCEIDKFVEKTDPLIDSFNNELDEEGKKFLSNIITAYLEDD